MLLDAITNTYLGLCKSKDGDKAVFILKIYFPSRSGITTIQKRRDIGDLFKLSNSVPFTSCFSQIDFWHEIPKSEMYVFTLKNPKKTWVNFWNAFY